MRARDVTLRAAMSQQDLDASNAEFWTELCGTGLARELGITGAGPDALQRFDQAYLAIYPYLAGYADREPLAGRDVLEIGLGYGTLGQVLASRGCRYHGLDISPGPVAMMQARLRFLGETDGESRVKTGSALENPFGSKAFSHVYSIGCLHHTGDLPRAISEVHRVLAPGGRAIVMLYNDRSYRRLVELPWRRFRDRLRGRIRDKGEQERAAYDANAAGQAAPHTDFVSKADVRRLFGKFTNVRIEARNFDSYGLARGRIHIRREWFLGNVDRLLGLDLYITATK